MVSTILVASAVCSFPVKADEANVHFGSQAYDATEGEQFPVGVYVNTEVGTGPYVVTVKYDPNSLQYVGGADVVDEASGLLGFYGEAGGPEIKYLVNFNVKGTDDTSLSFATAEVHSALDGELCDTSFAAAAPVRVSPAPEEEEEEEEAEEEETVHETNIEQQAPRPHLADAEETVDATKNQADPGVAEIEKRAFFNNELLVSIMVTFGLAVLVIILIILVKSLVKMARGEYDDDDEFFVDYEDESDLVTKPLKSSKSGVKMIGNVPFLDLENEEEELDVEELEDEDEVVISVKNVTMKFKVATQNVNSLKDFFIQLVTRKLSYRELLALDDISFDVHKGEVMGIIGTNGSGKSTLLKIVSGALRPTEGRVDLDRRKVQLLTLGTGFDLELTARENVYLNGALIGYSKEFLDEHYDEIVEFAELEGFMEEKVKNFSSGMVSRLGFAIATAGDAAEILILDEVLSVGDEFFQKKSLKRVKEMIHGGSTVLLVSHGMGTILDNCTRVVWIEKGQMKMVGEPKKVCAAYRKMEASA